MKTLKNGTDHVVILDLLRGFAALAVVMVHFAGLGFLDQASLTKLFYYGTYGVHMFFVISGFVIPWSLYRAGYTINDFGRFIGRRFLRTSLPYYAAVLLVAVTHYLTGYDGKGAPFETSRVLSHFLYIVPFNGQKFYDPVFWTLTVEFQYYILIGLVFALLVKGNNWLRLAVYAAALGAFYIPFANNEFSVFHYDSLFVSGVLVFMFWSSLIEPVYFFLLTGIALVMCYFQLGIEAACVGTISVLAIAFARFRSRVTDWLGRISYSLYLTHNLSRLFLFVLLARIRPEASAGFKLGYLVFMVAAALVAAYFFHLLVERPAHRLSQRMFRKKKVSEEAMTQNLRTG